MPPRMNIKGLESLLKAHRETLVGTERFHRFIDEKSRRQTAGTADKNSVVDSLKAIDPSIKVDLMRLKGIEATQRYIINEVLRIYAAQGQDVADKHLEIIVRQMFSRVQIENPGDSTFVTGDIVSKASVVEANADLAKDGKELVSYTQLLLGITKVSIWSDSFLSAASFQDTTRVLINSAISGRIDYLHGLKENVIIGRKIPVGTGVEELSDDEDIVEQEVVDNIELEV